MSEYEPAFPKIGKHKKRKRPKLKPPEHKHCRYLGYVTGTERWAHAESRIIKFESNGGGAMGSKIPDDQTAWLSSYADSILSQPLQRNASDEELEAHAEIWRKVIKASHPEKS